MPIVGYNKPLIAEGTLSNNDENGFNSVEEQNEALNNNPGGTEDVLPNMHEYVMQNLMPRILSGTATPDQRRDFYNYMMKDRS